MRTLSMSCSRLDDQRIYYFTIICLWSGRWIMRSNVAVAIGSADLRRALGPRWQSFAAQTSIVPFAAIAAGRTQFNPDEISAWQWIVAVIAYALMLGAHSHITGVSPFPTIRPVSDGITKESSLLEIKFERNDGASRRVSNTSE